MYVMRIAYVGSSPFFVPWPNIMNPGRRLSLESACNSLADPMTPINVEKNELANSPARITTPEILVSWITLAFLTKDDLVIVAAMAKVTSVYKTKVVPSP